MKWLEYLMYRWMSRRRSYGAQIRREARSERRDW